MKRFSQFAGASVIALSLAVMPGLSVSAQTGTGVGTTTDTGTTTTTADTTEDDGFDWGWLGLLGLFGLAGLAGRNRSDEPARYREPDSVGRSTTYRE